MKNVKLVIAAVATAFVGVASAQSYTITTPGSFNSYIYSNPGGSYTITTPGQFNSYAYPTYGGGYRISTPGQFDTYIYRNPGSTVYNPRTEYNYR